MNQSTNPERAMIATVETDGSHGHGDAAEMANIVEVAVASGRNEIC